MVRKHQRGAAVFSLILTVALVLPVSPAGAASAPPAPPTPGGWPMPRADLGNTGNQPLAGSI